MTVRKRNEFLEASDSEAEAVDHGYDSEAIEESKVAATSRASKRRRTGDDDSLGGSESEGERAHTKAGKTRTGLKKRVGASVNAVVDDRFAKFDDDDDDNVDDNDPDDDLLPQTRSDDEDDRPSTVTIPKTVLQAQKKAQKSGVIYISRVPPFMKPQTLRHFLEPHAPHGLGRIFLTPEDHTAHVRRVKNGGNKKKSFSDGWVEFNSKREAKNAAANLNGNIIGGKKGNFYHDDLWTIKYLTGFKWRHLTEQISNENAEREARLREEIRKTREENRAFVQDFEHGKMLETKEKKKRAREGDVKTREKEQDREERDRIRGFKQRSTRSKEERAGAVKDSKELQNVLSKIF